MRGPDEVSGKTRRVLLGVIRFFVVAAPIVFNFAGPTQGRAQSPSQRPTTNATAYEFDVVSVKPLKSAPGLQRIVFAPDGLSARNVSVLRLIQWAYGIPLGTDDGRIAGGPSWITTERFDIDAKMDGTLAEALQKLSPDEIRIARQHMLQVMLADYFKLAINRETRQLQRYTLSVGKNGSKLQEATADEVAASVARIRTGSGAGVQMKSVRGGAAFQSSSMTQLVAFLSLLLERSVVDETGLTGLYNFTLKYVPDAGNAPAAPVGSAANGQPGAAILDADDSDVIAAVQQLGLKLESGKGPLEVIVVTHVERPAEN